MDIKTIILVSVAFLNFALGASIFLHGVKSIVCRRFALFSFGLAMWSFGMMLYATTDLNNLQTIYGWSLILHFAGAFIAHSFFYFSLAYPEEKPLLNKIWQILLSIPLFAVFYFLFIDPQIITSLNLSEENRQLIYGSWYPFYFTYFFLYMSAGLIILLIKSFYINDEVKKKQMRTVFFGILLPLIFAGIINMVLAAFGSFQYAWTGPIFLFLVVIFIAYAIIKLRFLDIKVIATEIFAIFLSSVAFIEIFVTNSFAEQILKIIIFIIIFLFAILLIRSVLKEVKRREELEKITQELAIANQKREKINNKLQKANIELKKLDQTKSEFISIASHQLRTPLTAIKGYGSMLLDGDFEKLKNEKQIDAVRKMFISNNRLINLVENLLNISRIESGKLKFDFKPESLTQLVKEIYENLKQNAEDKGLYLKFEEPKEKIPLVNMDSEKIRQIVINFIDNAIKYTKEGGITVSVYKKGNNVECCIADTGMGVSKEEQARLFKKFNRGKDAFLVNTEGMGLGLYVAQMMIQSHKGNIWVESEGEGKGSKFCFSLPLTSSKAQATNSK